MDFAKSYYNNEENSIDIDRDFPVVKVKLKDNLCFRGFKMPYQDLSIFVLRDDKFIPKIVAGDIKETDRQIDVTPLLAIGCAEMLRIAGSRAFIEFHVTFDNDAVYDNNLEIYHFLSELSSDNLMANRYNYAFAQTLRTDYIDINETSVRRAAQIMNITNYVSTKYFCKKLLEIMQFSQTIFAPFVYDMDKLETFMQSGVGIEKLIKLSDLYSKRFFSPKKIGYTVPNTNTKHYISNGRGLGIYAFLLLHFTIYNKFSERLSSDTYNVNYEDLSVLDKLQERFKACIGDDACGRFLLKGVKLKLDYDCKDHGVGIDVYPFERALKYTLDDGSIVHRWDYENDMMFRHASGVQFVKKSAKYRTYNVRTQYYGVYTMEEAASFIFLGKTEVHEFDISHINQLYSDMSQYREQNKNLDKSYRDLVKDFNELKSRITTRKDEDAKAYEQRINDLENQLATKTNIIEKLTEKVETLTEQIKDHYAEDDFIENIEESSVSIEDMVAFLKDYKIALIGGRMDILQKLEPYGLNIVQFENANSLNYTNIQCDFFCINTRFVAHNTINKVISCYKDQFSQFYYFNGTNVDYLIKASYDFIKNWLEG